MQKTARKKFSLSSFQLIILGFAALIVVGALLLMLPISSREGKMTPPGNALFTATSAACVTGLVVYDTASHWSAFGQSVILVLIQIGGLGVVTAAASISILAGRKLSLKQRSTMQESISAPKIGGIVKFTGFAVKVTFLTEFAGFLLLLPVFVKGFGARGIWMALFHSVSAFCNAGFDIMGTEAAQYQSLTSFAALPYLNAIIMLLIVVGGIGFLTWDDILKNRHHIKKYRMQSKVVLLTSGILIVLPAVFFFIAEYSSLPLGERITGSLFQSVTTRTAGFNTQNLSVMTGAGKALMICLMLVGGSPGSTAGGMKTTTLAVLLSNLVSVFRRREDTNFFGRRIDLTVVKNAAAIFAMYIALFTGGAAVISIADGLPIGQCLFETASAVGTVGLTLGITPALGGISKAVIVILMFLGRVGALTLVYAAASGPDKKLSRYPLENITVG
ncbi:MAG: Trk family potassium uptake protein [Clostridia bacterium]|nr:Trk family potassium uptake protein [Clostridia bacterium]